MIRIACVYRSGGDFTADDVAKLALSIKRHVSMEHRITCLTDRPDEVHPFVDEVISLKHNWPGWWAKMELFVSSALPTLYFDLDTMIVAPIDNLCQWVMEPSVAVMMLRGFYKRDQCSGIMGWNCDLSWLTHKFDKFVQNNLWAVQPHGIGCGSFHGDQEYIRIQLHRSAIPILLAQDIQQGIYSYKVDIQPTGKKPADASVICFHGRPRPHEVEVAKLC